MVEFYAWYGDFVSVYAFSNIHAFLFAVPLV